MLNEGEEQCKGEEWTKQVCLAGQGQLQAWLKSDGLRVRLMPSIVSGEREDAPRRFIVYSSTLCAYHTTSHHPKHHLYTAYLLISAPPVAPRIRFRSPKMANWPAVRVPTINYVQVSLLICGKGTGRRWVEGVKSGDESKEFRFEDLVHNHVTRLVNLPDEHRDR